MSLALFAGERYLIVLLLCGVAYIIGTAALSRLKFHNLAEHLAICTALGLGVSAQIILAIGLLGWLTLRGVLIAMVIALVIAVILLWRANKGPLASFADQRGRGWQIAAIILVSLAIMVAALPVLRLPLYPPTDFDVTMYHLAVVKMWVQARAIIPTPFLRGQVLPHTAHALFAALMLTKDDVTVQVLSLAATLLTALGLLGWGARVKSVACGCFAAALWLGSPAVLWMSGVASYHELAALFSFAAIFTLANYATSKDLGWLFVSAIFLGFAESTWSLTIYFIPVFAAAAIYFALKERRLRPLYVVGAGLLLGWGPGLLRAFYYTGNPTYPLFSTVFGTGPWWSASDLAAMANDIHRFGVPRTLWGFLKLPYEIFVTPEKFESTVSYSVLLFLFLPLVAFRCFKDRYLRWLTVIFAYYIVCWFVFGQITRYLLPIIPVLCAITAIAAIWLVRWLCHMREKTVTIILLLGSIVTLVPGLLFARKDISELGPIPLTKAQRNRFLAAHVAEYSALLAANRNPAPLYSLFAAQDAYYSDGLFLGDWFGLGRYSQVVEAARSGLSLYEVLHRLGAKYFLVSLTGGNAPPLPYDDPDFARHFELAYADASTELYRVTDNSAPGPNDLPNLLKNGGFDQLSGGWPTSWGQDFNPVVATPPGGADSGAVAAKVDKSNDFHQIVRISPSITYELRLKAKATVSSPVSMFRLQVNWTDDQGKICDVFIRVCNADTSWRAYSARMTAPACARMAIVYASGQTDVPVWLDTFSFRRATRVDSADLAPAAKSQP